MARLALQQRATFISEIAREKDDDERRSRESKRATASERERARDSGRHPFMREEKRKR